MSADQMQIGEVAARTGLSLRTIRYYEEVGLVTPSARSAGGFRLYAEEDVARLQLIRRMKPLDFSLDDMRELLAVVDALDGGASGADRDHLLAELRSMHAAAVERVESLRVRLDIAEEFANGLAARLGEQQQSDRE